MTVQALPTPAATTRSFHLAFVVAWFFCVLFYFMQYAMRSAPGVMHPELTAAFGLSAVGLSSLIGVYYYTYSTFALVAGAALDRWGAKYTIPLGVVLLAIGSVMFGLGIEWAATVGRLLQGAGAAFAFVGAVYLASHGVASRYLATAVGFTQAVGMLGGSAGQFAVAPLIHGPITWQQFWLYAGLVTLVIALVLVLVTPRQDPSEHPKSSIWRMFEPYKTVLSNPSILSLRLMRRAVVPAHDGPGHDLGRALPARGLAPGIWRGGQQSRDGAARLGGRCSVVGLSRGLYWPA
jgi:MFS family permease